jgi:hypothetical protein
MLQLRGQDGKLKYDARKLLMACHGQVHHVSRSAGGGGAAAAMLKQVESWHFDCHKQMCLWGWVGSDTQCTRDIQLAVRLCRENGAKDVQALCMWLLVPSTYVGCESLVASYNSIVFALRGMPVRKHVAHQQQSSTAVLPPVASANRCSLGKVKKPADALGSSVPTGFTLFSFLF